VPSSIERRSQSENQKKLLDATMMVERIGYMRFASEAIPRFDDLLNIIL
jgi:hypothetical protein